MVKAKLLEPKCPTSKSQGHGYSGCTSVGFRDRRHWSMAAERAELFVFGSNTLREARVVDNDPKDTKWAPNPA